MPTKKMPTEKIIEDGFSVAIEKLKSTEDKEKAKETHLGEFTVLVQVLALDIILSNNENENIEKAIKYALKFKQTYSADALELLLERCADLEEATKYALKFKTGYQVTKLTTFLKHDDLTLEEVIKSALRQVELVKIPDEVLYNTGPKGKKDDDDDEEEEEGSSGSHISSHNSNSSSNTATSKSSATQGESSKTSDDGGYKSGGHSNTTDSDVLYYNASEDSSVALPVMGAFAELLDISSF